MKLKWLKTTMMFVALIALGASLGACGGDGNECAPGTVEVGGECVPFCTDAEYWNGTECVAVPTCAAGTTLNPTTGECEPSCADGEYWTGTACAAVPTCADGTAFNAETGECEPACADGEYWDGTACAAVPDCPAGYELNDSGVCEALCALGTYWDTAAEACVDNCGEGTVLSDGVCLPWIDVVESDATEAAENNDAFMGGMPGMFALAAMDESIILEGVVDSVTDIDGDGYGDGDWDTWMFSASQGQRLHIEGWADGVFNVAFGLVGASEDGSNAWFMRYGLNPDSPESERDFVIPMDGDYILFVTDYANLVSDIPVGGPELGYFVAITEIANPAPVAGSAGTAQTGSVFDLDQVAFTGTAGELWDVNIDNWTADNIGLIPVHDATGNFVKQLENYFCFFGCSYYPLEAGMKFTMPMPADGGFLLTIDYFYRTGSGSDYGITAQPNPNVESLDVTNPTVLNEDLGSSDAEKIYEIDLTAGNIYSFTFENLGADVDASLYATIHDADFNAIAAVDTEYDAPPWEYKVYAQTDAKYYIRVIDWYQEEGADYTYDLVVNIWPVEDLGTLDATNTSISTTGEGPVANAGDEFWFAATVDQAAEVMGTFTPDAAWNLAFEIYDMNVMMLTMLDEVGDGEAEMFTYVIPADTYLFRVYESGMDMGDSSYTFSIDMTYDELQQEVEPNDEFGTATAMTEDAISGYCEIADIAAPFDWFSYTTAEAGVLFFYTGPGDFDADTYLWMFDTDGTTLLDENDDNDYYGGDYWSTTAAEVGAGTYYAAVGSYIADTNYVLYAELVPGACIPGNSYCEDANNAMVCNDFETGYEAEACAFGCGVDADTGVEGCLPPELDEVEPNDDFANAQVIVLDWDGAAEITEGDNDYYMFTLASDAVVTIETYDLPGGAGDTVMFLYDSAQTEIALNDDGGDGLYSLIAGEALAAGDYYVMVRGYGATTAGLYGLMVTAEVAICTPDATQCNVDGDLETCNAGGTAWDVTTCSYGCDDSGDPAVCNPAPPLINEVSYDQDGTDDAEFIEIVAEPGLDMTGYSVVFVNGNDGAPVWDIDLAGVTVPADGFLVIGYAAVENVDVVTTNSMQNGPDNVVLYWDYTGGAEAVIDAYGYESFDPDEFFVGEGTPDTGITYGSWNTSVGRYPDGADTDDNAADFVQAYFATPGGPNLGGAADTATRMSYSAEGAVATPIAIPTDNTPLELTMDFTGLTFIPSSLTDLNVALNIAHPYRGDLLVTLTAPDGTTSVILNDETGSFEDDIITAYDWETTPDVGSMDDFNGLDAQGVWTLTIHDTYPSSDDGILVDWALFLE